MQQLCLGDRSPRRPCLQRVVARSSSSSSNVDSVRALARDARPIALRLITVSKGSSTATAESAEEWAAKLRRYAPLEWVQLRPNPARASAPAAQVEAEAEKVLRRAHQPMAWAVDFCSTVTPLARGAATCIVMLRSCNVRLQNALPSLDFSICIAMGARSRVPTCH